MTYMVWTRGKDERKLRLRTAALHGHVRGGRSTGRQRKRWKDNVREDLEERGIQYYLRYMEKPRIEKFGEI